MESSTRIEYLKAAGANKQLSSSKKKGGQREAILLLGMHRSGTSALAGVFARLGATPPKALLQSNANNPKGYWESAALVNLHDRLLASAGSRWDDWEPFNPQWFQSPVAPEFAEELRDAILSEFGRARFIIVKDPRLCRFLPLWLEQLQLLNIGVRVVIPVRNPLEIAASLEKRNGLSVSWSLLLWLRHVLDAEAATRLLPRSFVRYEALLTDWRGVTGRLAEELHLSWPRRSGAADRDIDVFLSSELRHNIASDADLHVRGDVLEWVRLVFPIFARSTGAGISAEDRAVLDSVRNEFDVACRAFGALMADATVANKQLNASVDSHQARATELTSSLADRDSRIADLSGQIDDQAARIEELTRSLADRDSRIAELSGQIADQATRIEAETESELAQRRHEAEQTAGELAAAREELQRTAAARAETEKIAADLKEHVVLLMADVKERQAEFAAFQEAREADSEAVARMAGQIRRVLAVLDTSRHELAARLSESERERKHQADEIAALRRLVEEKHREASCERARADQLRHEAAGKMGSAVAGLLNGPVSPLSWRPLRLRRQAALLKRSGLFDTEWYVREYTDVASAGIDPLRHYIEFGAREGRAPNPALAPANGKAEPHAPNPALAPANGKAEPQAADETLPGTDPMLRDAAPSKSE